MWLKNIWRTVNVSIRVGHIIFEINKERLVRLQTPSKRVKICCPDISIQKLAYILSYKSSSELFTRTWDILEIFLEKFLADGVLNIIKIMKGFYKLFYKLLIDILVPKGHQVFIKLPSKHVCSKVFWPLSNPYLKSIGLLNMERNWMTFQENVTHKAFVRCRSYICMSKKSVEKNYMYFRLIIEAVTIRR